MPPAIQIKSRHGRLNDEISLPARAGFSAGLIVVFVWLAGSRNVRSVVLVLAVLLVICTVAVLIGRWARKQGLWVADDGSVVVRGIFSSHPLLDGDMQFSIELSRDGSREIRVTSGGRTYPVDGATWMPRALAYRVLFVPNCLIARRVGERGAGGWVSLHAPWDSERDPLDYLDWLATAVGDGAFGEDLWQRMRAAATGPVDSGHPIAAVESEANQSG